MKCLTYITKLIYDKIVVIASKELTKLNINF